MHRHACELAGQIRQKLVDSGLAEMLGFLEKGEISNNRVVNFYNVGGAGVIMSGKHDFCCL